MGAPEEREEEKEEEEEEEDVEEEEVEEEEVEDASENLERNWRERKEERTGLED